MLRKNLIFATALTVTVLGLWKCLVPRPVPHAWARAVSQAPSALGDVAEVASRIDAECARVWQARGMTPAPPADDRMVARRAALALVGSIPSVEELRRLQRLPAAKRIGQYVDYLLHDRRHADYFAEHLARAFVGTEGGPFLIFRRRRFVSWLSDRLHENHPYDAIVTEMITAEGLWTTHPEVNFLTVNADDAQQNRPNPVRMAGRTARAFLAVRLDCVECHDDRLNGDWLQTDFHQLAAYYSDASATLVGVRDTDRPYRYQYLHATEERVVAPRPPFHAVPLPADGRLREQLAAWVTHRDNRPFARAIVNRVWGLAFGRPLVTPVDNVPVEGPHPRVMELLADDLIEHDFDLRRLWRVIMQLEVFRRDSRAAFEVTEEHERLWAAFPVTRLSPSQLAGSLCQSSQLKTVNAQSHILLRAAHAGRVHEFVQAFGDVAEDGGSEEASGTIPQRLAMMNGKAVREATQRDLLFSGMTRVARLSADDDAALRTAFLAVLSRPPSPAEQAHFGPRLAARHGEQREAFLADLQWTLVNSAEFSWNH